MITTILIVEPNREASGAMASLLSSAGFVVSECPSARLSIAQMAHSPVDCVLLAHGSGAGDACPTSRAIRHSAPDAKIILYSNSITATEVQRALQHGADRLIYRQPSAELFCKRVEDTLDAAGGNENPQ